MFNVWLPARRTVGRAARVNIRLPIDCVFGTFGSVSAIRTNTTLFSTPAKPAPFCQVAAFHETSALAQVASPTIGGVKLMPTARTSTRSLRVAFASTMLSMTTETGADAVGAFTFVTAKEIVAGTLIRHCSPTVAVRTLDLDWSAIGTV